MSGNRANGNNNGNDNYKHTRRRSSAQPPHSSSARDNGIRSRSSSTPPKQPSSHSDSAGPPNSRLRKRKRSRAMKVLLIVLVVLALIAILAYAAVRYELNKINRLGATSFTSEFFDQDSSEADTISAVDWGKANVATSMEGVVNVLLVGQDTRHPGQKARSDSMILMSINKNTNQVTMVSLMRDLYVKIPGYSDNKLNAAYAIGGFTLLDEAIGTNFGIAIDYNVEVNFNGFKDIIDTLGGIDIPLDEAEAEYMNSTKFVSDMGTQLNHTFSAGTNHLDGQQALCYARIRHVGNSDWERTDRQRRVIQTIYSNIKKESWTNLLNIYSSIATDLTTDMNDTQMISIAFSAYSMGLDSINSYRIPADNMYSNEVINKMDVLIPTNWDQTRILLNAYLCDEDAGVSKAAELQKQAKGITTQNATTGTTGTTATTGTQ